MVPVAVSVPVETPIRVEMTFENWAFGNFQGIARN